MQTHETFRSVSNQAGITVTDSSRPKRRASHGAATLTIELQSTTMFAARSFAPNVMPAAPAGAAVRATIGVSSKKTTTTIKG